MENLITELKLEQQFTLAKTQDAVTKMSREQLESFAVEVCAKGLIQQNYYEALIKHKWGL